MMTLDEESLALSIAAGRPVWGVYGCKRGTVVHVDFEQGRRVTHERYQRLARGMGVDLRELGTGLRLAVHPSAYLTDADAERSTSAPSTVRCSSSSTRCAPRLAASTRTPARSVSRSIS
jgi:hypothetical protein